MLAKSLALMTGFFVFAALPSTSNYQLNSYGFGNGGVSNSTTSNYTLEGVSGELSAQPTSTANYADNSGVLQLQQSNVPNVTISNPSNYYDKLKFVIDTQNNPSDAKYALQISTSSDFSTGVNYVESDDTIGASLTISDYQTYSTWGGASGANIIGLASNTTYYLRAKATHFIANTNKITTESAYGPSSNATTSGLSLSFCAYTNANCAAGGSSVTFSGLVAGNVTNSPNNIGVDFATNANIGGSVYIYASNTGLFSSKTNYTIASATADLGSGAISEGFGAQIASVNQTTGGPLSKVSPYNNSSNNVGILNTTIYSILSSTSALTGGTGSIQLQVKPSTTTPASTDYSDTITLIAAAAF